MKNIIIKFVVLTAILINSASAKELSAKELSATIIGSGSPIYNENRASASVLISAGDSQILVDMGNGTQANLHKHGVDIKQLSGLFFTHHHLDHNEEFVPLLIRSLLGRHNFNIIGPPNTVKLTEANIQLYTEDISYRLGKTKRTLVDRQQAFDVKDIQGGESFNINGISVSTIKVPHTIHAIAYRFDYNGQSIVVTGDLTYSKTLSKLAKNADFMIIDSGGMVMIGGKKKRGSKNSNKARGTKRSGGGGNKKRTRTKAHLNLAESSQIARESNVSNLVYTHFTDGEINKDDSLVEIRKNYSGKVIFAEDLMVIKNIESGGVLNVPTNENNYFGQDVQYLTNQVTYTDNNKGGKATAYQIVDTGQMRFYGDGNVITMPTNENGYFGQDAQYLTNQPSYTDNNNETITDNVTGLMWQKDMGEKLAFDEAFQKVRGVNLGGHSDWRIPSIKELYSLIQFSGSVKGQSAINPFIDTKYFKQPLGNSAMGEREIDAQTWSSTEYVGKTMKSDKTVFGVNFVDGRIKGYPKYNPRTKNPNKMYFRFVRGNKAYGKNSFTSNGDGTIKDSATDLMWQQSGSTNGMNWESALKYCKKMNVGGSDDWRLPNAKELQSIVDYSRSPSTTGTATIDKIFYTPSILNEAGQKDYPYYWSSTSHLDGPIPEKNAAYVAFGTATGKMLGNIMDVHGAGSQRSDPKTGQAMSRGPQGDMVRVNNYVRCVSGGSANLATGESKEDISTYSDRPSNPQVKQGQQRMQNKRGNSQKENRFIVRSDKNGDGKVSQAEFRGPSRRFSNIDRNGDGYITADEAPKGRRSRP
jgi:ribonuclease BN (tRNA processing enzyme)